MTVWAGMSMLPTDITSHAKAGNDTAGTHPEIRDYLEEGQAVIRSPDLVFQSTRDARSRVFYHLRAGRGDFAGKHLVVIVKYAQQPEGRRGYVSTVYLSRSVYAQGALLWPRTESAPR